MKNKSCDLALLSAFVDDELDRRERRRMQHHLDICPQCRVAHEQLASLSTAFQGTMQRHYPAAAMAALDGAILDRWHQHQDTGWLDRWRRAFFSKWLLVPAAVAVAVVIMLPLQTRQPVAPSPSAIVQSVSGDLASVMIMQTPTMQQTVIWISENDEDQENAI